MSEKMLCISFDLLKSRAYQSLSSNAKVLLIEFLRRRKIKPIKTKSGRRNSIEILNNGRIVLPYKDIRKYCGIHSKATITKALRELAFKGFIDRTERGTGGGNRKPSLYLIDDRWQDFDANKGKARKPPKDNFPKRQERWRKDFYNFKECRK